MLVGSDFLPKSVQIGRNLVDSGQMLEIGPDLVKCAAQCRAIAGRLWSRLARNGWNSSPIWAMPTQNDRLSQTQAKLTGIRLSLTYVGTELAKFGQTPRNVHF